MRSFNVTNYNVQIHSEVKNPVEYNAFIGLNLVETNVPVAGQAVAFLNFYPDTTGPLPDNSVQTQGGIPVYTAGFHEHWFPSVTDLLRNEEPVTFFFDELSNEAILATGTQEPVGEGEPQP
jgi:hypothetical protein